jgi:hypothetical protein
MLPEFGRPLSELVSPAPGDHRVHKPGKASLFDFFIVVVEPHMIRLIVPRPVPKVVSVIKSSNKLRATYHAIAILSFKKVLKRSPIVPFDRVVKVYALLPSSHRSVNDPVALTHEGLKRNPSPETHRTQAVDHQTHTSVFALARPEP